MKHRAVIGIEIATDEVRGACVRTVGGALQLVGAASAPMPPGGVDAEGMLNAHEVGETVRRVCAQLDPRTSHVAVGMTGCKLVARVMEIPPVPDSEIRAVLRGEMDHYRILPAGQSAFDYYRLPDTLEKDGEAKEDHIVRVLLMGAEERLVGSYRAVIDASGMGLVAVEPGSIAILRALYPMLRTQEAVATVILSRAGTDIFITHEGQLQFYRRIDTTVPELYAKRGLDAAAPTPHQQGGGLLTALGEPEEAETPSPEGPQEVFNRQAVSLLMTEVQRSIDYFIREYPSVGEKMLVRCVLDAPDAADLFEVMTHYLRSEAEMASAMDSIMVGPEAAHAVSGTQGFRYTVAVGLALRNSGGEYASAPALDLGVGDPVIAERRIAPRALFASVATSLLILLGTIVASFFVGGSIARSQQKLAQAKNELRMLTEEHAQKVSRLERQKTLVEAIHKRDQPMREGIEFLAAAISRRACLTNLTIDLNGQIYISGEATTPRVVADIMDTINLSPTLEPVRLNNLTQLDPSRGIQGVKFDMSTGFLKTVVQAAAPPPASKPDAPGGT